MNVHHASRDFWAAYEALPKAVRNSANRSFERLKSNPRHPSLQFKPVGRYWSARVSLGYRALAVPVDDGLLWFWIGKHEEYDRIVG